MNRPSQPSKIIANKYRLVRRLGTGGMGSVYEAEHMTLTGRHVALKLLHEHYASNAILAARVVREARVTATLEHPGIVKMIDVEQDPELGPVLVMELLTGLGLDEILYSTGISPRQAVEITLEALDALGYAHAQNVVHRDIKPANLFIVQRSDGTATVKIVDFGIATVLGEESLTVPGAFLGTAVYASPEQRVSATKADAVSDLYSLGMTLLRTLVADRSLLPVGADDSRTPCVDAMRADHVPEALITFALRAIEHDRAKRFATAHDMAEALRPILAIETLSSRRVRPILVAPGPTNTLAPTRPERVESGSPVEPATAAGGLARSGQVDKGIGTKSDAPPPAVTAPSNGRTKVLAPIVTAGLAVVVALVALRASRLPPPPAPPATPSAAEAPSPAAAETREACRAWDKALEARQRADGVFGTRPALSANGWPTALAVYALVASDDACGPLDAARRGRLFEGLAAARTDAGWLDDNGQLSIVSNAWATLAYARDAWHAGSVDTRDAGASAKKPSVRSGLVHAQDARTGARLLVRAQLGDGGFPATIGPEGPRVPNAYATVMAAWAMLEAARLEATPELVLARTRALQWIRRSLADNANPNAARRVPGLAEEAVWVLWQGHRLASDFAPEDTTLAADVAKDILARCAPVTSPSFRCGQENFENGSVVVEGPASSEPTTLEVFWLPWAMLAASEVSADQSVVFDEATRGKLHAMSLWARTYLSEMRVSILRENVPMFGEFLFALGQTLDKT